MKVHVRCFGLRRRPRGIRFPFVLTCHEGPYVREIRFSHIPEVIVEKWEFDVFPVPETCLAAETNFSQCVAVHTGPATVMPRPPDDPIARPGAFPGNGIVNVDCAPGVLGVEPTCDNHHRRPYTVHMLRNILCLPVLVVGPVFHELVPVGDLSLEIPGIRVRQGTQLEEEPVSVRRTVVESSSPSSGCRFAIRLGWSRSGKP